MTLALRPLSLAVCLALAGCDLLTDPDDQPDAQPIIYAFTDDMGTWHLYQTDAHAATPSRIDLGVRDGLYPAVSPDWTRLAFMSQAEPAGVYVSNTDGSHARLVYPTPHADHIAWSPDGSRLAIAEGDITIVTLDGIPEMRITADGTALRHPSWAPDESLVFAIGVYDFFLMSPERDAIESFRESDGPMIRDPAWSPDGTRLAFAMGDNGGSSIYTVAADGIDLHRLTTIPAGASYTDLAPDWSPSGEWIAFQRDVRTCDAQARCDNRWDIFVMRQNGSGLRTLTQGTDGGVRPTW